MSLSRFQDISKDMSGSDFEIPVAVFAERSIIEDFGLSIQKDALKEAVNYVTLQLIDKGIDGTGNTIILSITTNDNDPTGIDLIKDMIIKYQINYSVIPGSVISLKKIDAAAAVSFGYSSIVFISREY